MRSSGVMDGIHHVALFTADYAATAGFYREVFGADAPDDCEQPSIFRAGGVTLHVFEESSIRSDWSPARLHHVALQASDLGEFVAIRDRLLARGACDERVIDFGVGAHVSVLAADPDGGIIEILLATRPRRLAVPGRAAPATSPSADETGLIRRS
jgi:catechol 2,3-dioxygenase-like lactoylglutathione lyase family enzyme